MVGGIVIGLSRKDGQTHVHVADCPHWPKHDGCPNPDTCCVYTDEVRTDTGERVEIMIGDSVWWQSDTVFWNPPGTDYSGRTPRFANGKATYDIPLLKIGYSH